MITFSFAAQDALALRAQQGDARAFEDLYRSLDLLIRRIAGQVAARYSADLEDLHSAAWLAVWRYALPRWEPSRGPFRPFAAHRAFLQARRAAQLAAAKDRPRVSLDEVIGDRPRHDLVAADGPTPEAEATERQLAQRLVRALRRMPGRDGDLVLLRLAGHTLRRAAPAIGVGSRQRAAEIEERAVERVRRLMECA